MVALLEGSAPAQSGVAHRLHSRHTRAVDRRNDVRCTTWVRDQWSRAADCVDDVAGVIIGAFHHCGETTAGQYALTVNYTDIATQWTEQRAVWGKGETGVFEQTKDAENSLPFAIRGFDSDNGSEFINTHLYKYFTQRSKNPVQFTRSRAYHSNDNSHIEQKNWTHVRQWLGYYRFDNSEIVPLLNDLYKTEWRLYHNFFIPSVKLLEKKRVGSKTIKRYDKPKTPFQRILEADPYYVSNTKKNELQKLFNSLNPFVLRRVMEKKIDKILKIATSR